MMRALVILMLCCSAALARDDGRYANSPLKPWFDGLRSEGGGLCCSGSDGVALADVDWESKDGHYRVRLPHTGWVDVPESAVVKGPNLFGRTMVWPYPTELAVRCFMPGSMT